MCVSFRNITWSGRLLFMQALRRISRAPSTPNKAILTFSLGKLVVKFISSFLWHQGFPLWHQPEQRSDQGFSKEAIPRLGVPEGISTDNEPYLISEMAQEVPNFQSLFGSCSAHGSQNPKGR